MNNFDFRLPKFEDTLFSTEEQRQEARLEKSWKFLSVKFMTGTFSWYSTKYYMIKMLKSVKKLADKEINYIIKDKFKKVKYWSAFEFLMCLSSHLKL